MTYRSLKGRPDNYKDWEDILEMALFSLLSYNIYGLGLTFTNYRGWTNTQVVISQALLDNGVPINWLEIVITATISFVIAFIASFLYTKDTINKIGRKLRVTSMFGNKDVWDFYYKNYGNQWAFVRDYKTDMVYYGHILSYSNTDKERELIITDVDVYTNTTSEFRYSCPVMYISRSRDDLTIEIPDFSIGFEEPKKETCHERTGQKQGQITNQNSRSTSSSRSSRERKRESTPDKSKA
ncbi:hypothetical protein [Candidatus Oscillochloris fontis]|uniref:hypothetical protein n=1 Tax=Candidatus Oscillochloris fontis TaxID=2496868 RepID=UPI00101D8131|nr:hypothetical protein [Candidatus Oscillochloris fontis]